MKFFSLQQKVSSPAFASLNTVKNQKSFKRAQKENVPNPMDPDIAYTFYPWNC